jgi:hypothetical protein
MVLCGVYIYQAFSPQPPLFLTAEAYNYMVKPPPRGVNLSTNSRVNNNTWVGFFISLAVGVLLTPVLSLVNLLIFKKGTARYGVHGGIALSSLVWSAFSFYTASIGKKCKSGSCKLTVALFASIGIVFLFLSFYCSYKMRCGLKQKPTPTEKV